MNSNKFLNYIIIAALFFGVATLNTSCKKEGCTNENATNYDDKAKKDDGSCKLPPKAEYNVDGLVEVGRTYASATEVVLYAKEAPFVGYNYLYVLALDSASKKHINSGHVELMPVMDMGMHKHSCLVENPSSENANSNGLFEAQVGFVMPSSAGKWEVSVKLHRHDNHSMAMAAIPVNVAQPSNRLMASFIDSSSTKNDKVFIMYALPEKPQVGLNDMEIVVFKKQDMMTWPAVTDYALEIEPSMPSMGHGSPNNVHPTHKANGHYMGKVNYTMTGLWRIDVDVLKNGDKVSDKSYFEYTL